MFCLALLEIRFCSSVSSSTKPVVAPQNATAPRNTDASTLSSRQSKERSTLRFAFESFFLRALRSCFKAKLSTPNASLLSRRYATSNSNASRASCLSWLSVWLFAKTIACLKWTTCRAACSACAVCNKAEFLSKVTFTAIFSASAVSSSNAITPCCVWRVCISKALLSISRCCCSNLSSLAI